MTERTRFYIRITGFLGVTAVIAFGLWFLMFRGAPSLIETPVETPVETGVLPGSDTTTGHETTGTTTEPGAGVLTPAEELPEGQVIPAQLTSSAIVSPTITGGNKVAFYNPTDGLFYTIDKAGNIVKLSSDVFPKASSVTFSDDAARAVIEFPDGTNIVYNFASQTQTTLPSHWTEFEFSTDGETIVTKSMSSTPGNDQLVLASADGSQAESIANLGDNEAYITPTWSPNNNVVAFSATGGVQSAFGRQEIYLIDSNGNAPVGLIVDGGHFEAIWSPNGTHLFYSVANPSNDYKPVLWYSSADGKTRKATNLPTWVEKCTFKDDALAYCAVPRSVPTQSGYDHRLVTAFDDVYILNLSTGSSRLLTSPVTNVQMTNLSVSDDGNILYFTDQYGRLNSIVLSNL
ncbi:MAG: hypothetical protein WCT24_02090 [Patescibacteria group bacterium]